MSVCCSVGDDVVSVGLSFSLIAAARQALLVVRGIQEALLVCKAGFPLGVDIVGLDLEGVRERGRLLAVLPDAKRKVVKSVVVSSPRRFRSPVCIGDGVGLCECHCRCHCRYCQCWYL